MIPGLYEKPFQSIIFYILYRLWVYFLYSLQIVGFFKKELSTTNKSKNVPARMCVKPELNVDDIGFKKILWKIHKRLMAGLIDNQILNAKVIWKPQIESKEEKEEIGLVSEKKHPSKGSFGKQTIKIGNCIMATRCMPRTQTLPP